MFCPPHLQTWGVKKIWKTQYSADQHDTTTNYVFHNKHRVEVTPLWNFYQKLAIISFVKVEFVTDLLNWIALNSIGVQGIYILASPVKRHPFRFTQCIWQKKIHSNKHDFDRLT